MISIDSWETNYCTLDNCNTILIVCLLHANVNQNLTFRLTVLVRISVRKTFSENNIGRREPLLEVIADRKLKNVFIDKWE